MEYGIRELAEMAGVSARTLRWYDEVGLLRPARVAESGYRYYTSAEADRLQLILFYREMGMGLSQIAAVLDDPGFDRLAALRGQLESLEAEQGRLEVMIDALKRAIRAEEGKKPMMDHEKFEAFKRSAVEKNEAQYGKEAREKYGNAAVDGSNRRMMNMSPEQHARWEQLDAEILSALEAAVSSGANPSGEEGRRIAELHKQWLCCVWEKYTPEAHRGVAQMYVCDERFTRYYDRNIPGCAEFLKDAVSSYIKNRT